MQMPEARPPSSDMGDLSEAEQLVVRAFRRWLAGPEHQSMLWRTLAHDVELPDARAALAAVEAMIRVLGGNAHRNIRYHQPCCGSLGPDEAGLMTLVSAAQHEQHELAHFVAGEFVHPAGVAPLIAAARALGEAIGRSGLVLPVRFGYCAPVEREAESEPRRLHVLH